MIKDLYQVLTGIEGKVVGKLPAQIADITINSKKVVPGSLFVAIRGNKEDGHRYAAEAMQNGASVLLVETALPEIPLPQIIVHDTKVAASRIAANYFEHPTRKLKVIGVTGTNGKTTTVYLLNQILKSAGIKRGTIGTLGYSLEDERTPSNLTTPDSIQLQQIFHEMVKSDFEVAVMEVSSHALALRRVADVNFYAGVFTNISQDHLDFHKTIDDYARTKAQLFAMVNLAGFLVLNIEDEFSRLFSAAARTRILTYALRRSADYRWAPGVSYQNGIRGKVLTPDGEISIESSLSGDYNLKNILAAVAVAQNLGISAPTISTGIAQVENIPGRLQEIPQPGKARVFVDYAHTPDAIRNVLKTLQAIKQTDRRLIVIFGCGGNRDRSKRPLMAQAVASYADLAIITTDNPRFEKPEAIIEEALTGFPAGFNYQVIVDREKAIQEALRMAQPDDIVAILGKGHETYQEIQGQRYPFSDSEVVRKFWIRNNA